MNSNRKKELFPFFAFVYSQQMNPERYGSAQTFEEWSNVLQQYPEDVDEITKAAAQLTDQDWVDLETQYNEKTSSPSVENEIPAEPVEEETEEALMAKKGAKLNKIKTLQSYKKGKAMSKKCACGCDMVMVKEKGGKLTSKCACGCKSKKEEGGKINEKVTSMKNKFPAFKQKKK